MSAMLDMSRAIRQAVEKHGKTLGDLPQATLDDFAAIVTAYAADLQNEQKRRKDAA